MRFRRLLFLCVLALPAVADEGMWLFNQFPKDQVKEKYGFGAVGTLAKGVVTGDTPEYHKAGRTVLYTKAALDEWALAKISGPLRSRPSATECVLSPVRSHSACMRVSSRTS